MQARSIAAAALRAHPLPAFSVSSGVLPSCFLDTSYFSLLLFGVALLPIHAELLIGSLLQQLVLRVAVLLACALCVLWLSHFGVPVRGENVSHIEYSDKHRAYGG